MKLFPVILFSCFTLSLLTPAFCATGEEDGEIKAVRDMAQKFEIERSAAKNKKSFDATHLPALYFAVEKYFSPILARGLQAQLKFEPNYREKPDRVHETTRKTKSDPHVKTLGDNKKTDVRIIKGSKTQTGYELAGGDVDSLKRLQSACFGLEQALKGTNALNSKEAKALPVQKNLRDLLRQAPEYVQRYLQLDGADTDKYERLLGEVEGTRKQLLVIQKDYLEEMANLRKSENAGK